MEEENKNVEQPVEVVESVSEETINEINNEVEKVEASKIEEAKTEGAKSIADALREELAQIKAHQEAVEKKRAEEEEVARLKAEIEAEKAKAQAPIKKHIAQEAPNPTQVQTETLPQENLSEPTWEDFDRAFKGGVTAYAKKK